MNGSKSRWYDTHLLLVRVSDRRFFKESGDFIDSFTSRYLRPNGIDMVDAEQEDIVKWCAGGLYAGAGDTVRFQIRICNFY